MIALWLAVVLALSSLAGLKGHEVLADDTAQFLPKSSESAQATRFAQTAFGQQEGTTTVTVLVQRADRRPLTAADRAEIAVCEQLGSAGRSLA